MLSLVVLNKLDCALASTGPSVLLLAAPQRALMRVNSSRIWSKLGLSAANRQGKTPHTLHIMLPVVTALLVHTSQQQEREVLVQAINHSIISRD